MTITGNKITASEGKVLQRISDKWQTGKSITLGKSYYMYGQKLDEPFQELPEHYEEIDEVILDEEGEVIVPKIIPKSITMRQTRLALLAQDKLTVVETAIEDLNDPATTIEWTCATVIERDNPLVNSLCSSLGMTKDEVDDLFIYANTL